MKLRTPHRSCILKWDGEGEENGKVEVGVRRKRKRKKEEVVEDRMKMLVLKQEWRWQRWEGWVEGGRGGQCVWRWRVMKAGLRRGWNVGVVASDQKGREKRRSGDRPRRLAEERMEGKGKKRAPCFEVTQNTVGGTGRQIVRGVVDWATGMEL